MRLKQNVPVAETTSTNFESCAPTQQSNLKHKQNTEQPHALQTSVSVFNSVKHTIPSESITLSDGLKRIKSGHYRAEIERLQPIASSAFQAWKTRTDGEEKSEAEKQYDALKRTLPAYTWSGQFSVRRANELHRHSGVLCVDVDHLDTADVDELRNTLRQDPHVLFLFRSPSYHGLKIGIPIDCKRHAATWEAVALYFRDCYGFEIDSACKDVSRLCFVSYDPELFVNQAAQPFTVSPPSYERRNQTKRTQVEELLSFIPTRPNYTQWIRIISAVGEVLPDTEAIEVLSHWSPEERPGEYAAKLQHRLKYIRFGTLVFMARKHGWTRNKSSNISAPQEQRTTPPQPNEGLIIKRASDVTASTVQWLWKDRIPVGHFTIAEGDPGIGKSTVINAEIPARISKGEALYQGAVPSEPRDVILLSAEDDPADTIVPRLLAAGADLSRIHLITGIRESNGKDRTVDLSRDLEFLRTKINETNACLVVIDPLNAYLGPKIDSYKDASVRQILSPLAALAQETGVAIVGIRHWGKNTNGKAIHKGLGSTGFTAAARCVLQFAVDPEKPDLGQVVIAVGKSNLSRFPESVVYSIEERTVHTPDNRVITSSGIVWNGSSKLIASELCSEPSSSEQRIIRDEVENFILRELKDSGGRIAASKIHELGKEIGYSSQSLNRAKAKLNIKSVKIGSPKDGNTQWFWRHP